MAVIAHLMKKDVRIKPWHYSQDIVRVVDGGDNYLVVEMPVPGQALKRRLIVMLNSVEVIEVV